MGPSSDEPGDDPADRGATPEARGEAPVGVDIRDREYGVYECVDCENVVLSLRDADGMTCHGEEMEKVTDHAMEVQPPDLREVLLEVFGLPKAGLDICLCVIGEGPVPPAAVADRLGYDTATVRTYLNTLVDLGLLTRSQLNRERGGVVNVYHSVDLPEMRRETLVGFYLWAGEAASLIEQANLTKEDYLQEDHDDALEDIFWEQFRERAAGADTGEE